MMKPDNNVPETPATVFLRKHGIAHSNHLYTYEEHGGTKVSARELNVPEHAVVKTLVMEDENAKPLIVLMHGDCKVSTKELARQIVVKKVAPCKPEDAHRHTGYMVGG
ncbi:MAG: Cys-tRNA(Pro) deacylase, partial [Rhodocyclales bacterium]|nr:Cys-tRNA(Pro) deacylase [Rhodocyclales bacterium]